MKRVSVGFSNRWHGSAKRLLASLGALVASVSMSAQEPVRIAGSDLLGEPFAESLKAYAHREGIAVTLDLSGSRSGIEKLNTDTAEIAFVMLAPDEALPAGKWAAEPMAYRVAIVAVPARVELSQLSLTELDGFFGASGPAGYTQWRHAGVEGPLAPLTVTTHVLAGRADELSTEIFQHIALRGKRLKPAVQRHTSVETLREKMGSEEGGLAILPVPPTAAEWTSLAIARGENDPAFSPTLENIHHGDYPLRWPVWVVYRERANAQVKALLRFVWSDEAAQALCEGSDCLPLPASVRAQK